VPRIEDEEISHFPAHYARTNFAESWGHSHASAAERWNL